MRYILLLLSLYLTVCWFSGDAEARQIEPSATPAALTPSTPTPTPTPAAAVLPVATPTPSAVATATPTAMPVTTIAPAVPVVLPVVAAPVTPSPSIAPSAAPSAPAKRPTPSPRPVGQKFRSELIRHKMTCSNRGQQVYHCQGYLRDADWIPASWSYTNRVHVFFSEKLRQKKPDFQFHLHGHLQDTFENEVFARYPIWEWLARPEWAESKVVVLLESRGMCQDYEPFVFQPRRFYLMAQGLLEIGYRAGLKSIGQIHLSGHSGAYRALSAIVGAKPNKNCTECQPNLFSTITLLDGLYGAEEDFLAFIENQNSQKQLKNPATTTKITFVSVGTASQLDGLQRSLRQNKIDFFSGKVDSLRVAQPSFRATSQQEGDCYRSQVRLLRPVSWADIDHFSVVSLAFFDPCAAVVAE